MDSEDRGVKDEEVGELWRWLNSTAPIDLPLHKECRDLIVKLVEEHQRRHGRLDLTLAHFGIDPATWPKEGA